MLAATEAERDELLRQRSGNVLAALSEKVGLDLRSRRPVSPRLVVTYGPTGYSRAEPMMDPEES